MDAAALYGGAGHVRHSDVGAADPYGHRQGEGVPVHRLPAEDHFTHSPDLPPAAVFENKVFAVFLAEPVSDFISVMAAAITFFLVFRPALAELEADQPKTE